jgi:hypothetical protein
MRSMLLIGIISTYFLKIKDILMVFEKIGVLPAQVSNYLYWTGYNEPLPIYHPTVLKQIIICFLFLFLRKNDLLHIHTGKSVFLFKIYFVSTLYYLFFLDFEIIAGRTGSLFSGVESLFLLQIIYDINYKQKKLLKLGIFVLACFLFISNSVTFTQLHSYVIDFQ